MKSLFLLVAVLISPLAEAKTLSCTLVHEHVSTPDEEERRTLSIELTPREWFVPKAFKRLEGSLCFDELNYRFCAQAWQPLPGDPVTPFENVVISAVNMTTAMEFFSGNLFPEDVTGNISRAVFKVRNHGPFLSVEKLRDMNIECYLK